MYSDPAVDGYSGKALGEILINCLRKRLAALGGAQKLAIISICLVSCAPSALPIILLGELISVSLVIPQADIGSAGLLDDSERDIDIFREFQRIFFSNRCR